MSLQMTPMLAQQGGRYYHIAEHEGRRLTLSKASLGEFVFEILSRGGEIMQLWPFAPKWKRSPVYPVVAMTPKMRDEFVEATGFLLVDPPRLSIDLRGNPRQ
ncbi:hypothetical protein [Methylobacterium indicum]|nr:hypothetical protein [Methylobacterium indicum]